MRVDDDVVAILDVRSGASARIPDEAGAARLLWKRMLNMDRENTYVTA
jgi:hypothetical protein